MKKEVLTGESELEANTLSGTLESLPPPAACRCEEACAVWWKGAPVNSAPGVISPCRLRRKSCGSPGQAHGLHIFLSPYYTIFANRKRSSCSPSPALLGKVLVSTSQWEDPSSVEHACQKSALQISVWWCSPLWHPENEKYGYNYKWNLVFFLRFPSQWLINILSNGALLNDTQSKKKAKALYTLLKSSGHIFIDSKFHNLITHHW